MGQVASPLLSVLPLSSAVVIVAMILYTTVRAHRHGVHVPYGDIAWSLAPAVVSLFIAIWNYLGNVEFAFGPLDFAAFSLLMPVFAFIPLICRRPINKVLSDISRHNRVVRASYSLFILVVVAAISTWYLDYAWLGNGIAIAPKYFFVSFVLMLMAIAALYYLGQRGGALASLVPVAALGFRIAQHFVLLFKGTAILPSDLLVLGTAAEVSSGYMFILSQSNMYAICACSLCLSLLSLLISHRDPDGNKSFAGVVLNCSLAFVLFLGLWGVCASMDFEKVLGSPLDRWLPVETYRKQGFLTGFIEMMQDLKIPLPDGYSDEKAENTINALVEDYDRTLGASPRRQASSEQYELLRPSVVVVMNESFSDFSLHNEIADQGYEGPRFFNSLADVLGRGAFMTSVVGGATANTEFEFLTGSSTAFLGSYKYPYQLYDFTDVESLPGQFAANGYDTTAIHPMSGENYNRSSNYQRMGFEQFLDIEEFADADTYHVGASDKSTYDKILDLLRCRAAPQFIFDVTMQNHGGYAPDTVPAEDMVDWAPNSLGDSSLAAELNTYLTCIEASDRDLRDFVEELKRIDRPVVLIFFGDHQPNIAAGVNDALHPDEGAFAHQMRTYQTHYMVWANYDVASSLSDLSVVDTSASQLAAQVLYTMGAPLSDYQKAQLVLGSQIDWVNFVGYRGADGFTYELQEESPYEEALNDLQTIQYFTFAQRVM